MQERYLHFLWKYRKCDGPGLKLRNGLAVFVIHPGHHNALAGPDFLDARIRIGDTVWAGHVEIHIHASDWYVHKHEVDPAYDNVILHVVWHDNMPVVRTDGSTIPTLELRHRISSQRISAIQDLIHSKQVFINCEKDLATVDRFVVRAWQERLFTERLHRKVGQLKSLLSRYSNHWNAVFFLCLAQGYGSKINRSEFLQLAQKIPFEVILKEQADAFALEALLFGMAGLLVSDHDQDDYYINLRKKFQFLNLKYELCSPHAPTVHFFKLRPVNFPTIRLSQLAQTYHRGPELFDRCMALENASEIYSLFKIPASAYWDTHYTFGKKSPVQVKIPSRAFIDGLIINVVLPLRHVYIKEAGKKAKGEIAEFISGIKPEKNNIIKRFENLGLKCDSALDTQAVLEMYQRYCKPNRCLSCALGHHLLKGM